MYKPLILLKNDLIHLFQLGQLYHLDFEFPQI